MNWESQLIALLSALLVRPFVLAAAAGLVLRVFRVRHPASRHAVWSVVLFAMLLLPIVSVATPHWGLPAPPRTEEPPAPKSPVFLAPEPLQLIQPPETISLPSQPAPSRTSLTTLVVWCYFAGLFAMLLYRAVGWVMLLRVVARSTQIKGRALRESRDVIAPVAVGVLRPAVILPAGWRDWNAETRRAVLAHEFAHIRRNDTLISALARFVKCVLWFHPLAWGISRRVSQLAELACDAVALESLRDPGKYSRILLAFASGVNRAGYRVALPGLAMAASSSGMRKRIDQVFELADGSARKLARPGAVLALIGLPVMCLAATLGFGESSADSPLLRLPPIVVPKAPELRAFQQAPPPAPAGPRMLRVLVPTTVFDRNGGFVANLPQSAFKVFENGVEQPLSLFREEQLPLSMGLIVDASGSMRDKRPILLAAAKALVNLPTPQDEMFVVSFNENAHIDQDWTNDESKLLATLDKPETRGGSALRDAVSSSIDKIQRGGKNETKVLFLVTDGNDNTSKISQEELTLKAQQSGVAIYCIGLLNEQAPSEARNDHRMLHELGVASGGEDDYPRSVSDLDPIAPRMLHNTRSRYLLGYLPANTAMDAARNIKVVVNRPDLIVRTRTAFR